MKNLTIWQLIQSSLDNHRDALAVSGPASQLTYAQLEHEVKAFGAYLQSRGVKPNHRVAILLPRNTDLLISILGVLSVGACYVPLFERYPPARNQAIIDDAGCQFMISATQYDHVECISPESFKANKDGLLESALCHGSEHDLAYIIYTSGSTGQPKGVMISHANALSMIQWAMRYFDNAIFKYTLASTSICFDLSIFEMFVPLALGGCVVIVENALSLVDTPMQLPITLINTVPSAAKSLLLHAAFPPSVRVINLAGEALEQSLVDALYDTTSVESIFNLYGPSETTTYSTYYLAKKTCDRTMVPIGWPIDGTQIFLLDTRMQPVPKLAKGEIYIAGPGVTLGYCNREEETKARYVEIKTKDGAILAYRTGDLARLNADNEYEYLGRLDHQIKLHGFRIELNEITKHVKNHKDVKDAFVMEAKINEESTQLVAYIESDEPLNQIDMIQWLSQWLPDYMIPKYLVFIEKLPLNTNGKIDRNALPLPEKIKSTGEIAYDSPLEKDIAAIWADLLGQSELNRDSHFFYVGGHSLLAARLAAKFKSQFNIACHLEELFHNPTIKSQAILIASRLAIDKMPEEALFSQARPQTIPLSYGQERLWYLQYTLKELPISNIPIVIKIKGRLNVQALEWSINQVILRHEILRTNYVTVNHQVIQHVREDFSFHIVVEAIDTISEIDALLALEANKPFDLTQDIMIRAKQFVLNADESIVMLTQHHIASDAWSLNILMHELSSFYKAYNQKTREPQLPKPVQYADYSCWQRGLQSSSTIENELLYWKKTLENAPDGIKLPFDRKRGETQTYAGAFYTLDLDKSLVEQLKRVALAHESTLFMVLLTAFDILLQRYSGQNDFCVGILSANRPFDALSHSLGFFVNTLVSRHTINESMSCQALLAQVRTTVLDSLAHQSISFDKVVEALRTQHKPNQHPLFNVLFSLQNAIDTDLTLEDLSLEVVEYDRKIAKFDLTLSLVERKNALVSIFEYNTDLFDKSTIDRMASHYVQILHAICKDISQSVQALNFLTQEEYQALVVQMNAQQSRLVESRSISAYFDVVVSKFPEKTAVVFESESLSYKQLHKRASQLAHTLSEYGVGHGMPVGLLLPRSIDAVVSMLAILKVGGFYVPINPQWPTDRLDFILQDAEIGLILTNDKSMDNLPTSSRVFILNLDTLELSNNTAPVLSNDASSPQDACYVMYTSGSTGKPKGVVATHAGVVRLVQENNYVTLNEEDCLLQVSPMAFDGSTFDIWGSLLNGATLVLMPDNIPELNQFASYLVDYKISTLFVTTQLFNCLVETKLEAMSSLKQVLFGGEVASISHVARFKERYPACKLSNIYGPTECTTFALSYVIPPDFNRFSPLPLGYPISNTSVVILSDRLQICPKGVVGEIYLGGPGLAREYLNQKALTEEKFINNPFSELDSARLYRTGDLGYYRQDGAIVFVGRIDNQIKLRGFRIELSEIEQALRAIAGVLDAVVLVQNPQDQLVAYLKIAEGSQLAIRAIRHQLSQSLPHYMLPDGIVLLDAYPLNANGKIDKGRLPQWAPSQDPADCIEKALDNPFLQTIQTIWIDVLGHKQITSNANFFEIGGNSLKLILVLDKLQEHFHNQPSTLEKLDIVTLFQYPTLSDLSTYLSEEGVVQKESVTQTVRVNQRDKRRAARSNAVHVE